MSTDLTGEHKMLSIITALEYRSQHPLASAVINKAEHENISYSNVSVKDFSSITGQGIRGKIDGTYYYIGNSKLFSDLPGIHLTDTIKNTIASLQQQGKTVMLSGTADSIEAIIAVADEVRETSQESLRRLHEAGIKETIMLTGENQSTANAIGEQVGVTDVRAELLPQDKLEVIKQLKSSHKRVAMVGDGVNDAPALAASTVGIAMGSAG